MKIAYTKYAIIAFSIAALSSISLVTQASPKGGHSSGSQTHSSGYSGGHSNYQPHGGYRPHGNPHGGYGYRPHGVGHGYYPLHSGYYQPYPAHGIHFVPSISANIHLPGFSLNLH